MQRLRGEHFSVLFDRALDAVVGMDDQGIVIAWNPMAEEIFGWTREEAIGRQMGELIVPAEHRDAHEAGLKHFNATGEGPVLDKRIQITGSRKVGEDFPVELSIIPVSTETGTIFFAFIRSLEAEVIFERERERRLLEASIMASVSAALLETLPTEDFIRLCLQKICEAAGWSVGHFYQVNDPDEPTLLVPSRNWHIGETRFAGVTDDSLAFRFRKGEGLPGKVWDLDDAIVTDDLSRQKGFLRLQAFRELGLTKAFAFPIHKSGGFAGVMEFFGTGRARADDSLQVLARTIADHVGVAIERNEENTYREILRRELSHRVGNSLTVLGAIFRRCAQDASNVDALVTSFEPRLEAIGRAHRLTSKSVRQSPELGAIIASVIELLPEQAAVNVTGKPVVVSGSDVLPLTLILSELVTNTIKHGIWQDHAEGRIDISWTLDEAGDEVRLVWLESPSTGAVLSSREGYGTTLINLLSEGNLQGRFHRDCTAEAFVFELEFPL